MLQKGYYKHWIVPVKGQNAGTVYADWPVGNSPELMVWDCLLNKNVDDDFIFHKALTSLLDRDDPLMFDSVSPKLLNSAYLWLLDPLLGPNAGASTGTRIIQDITKCMGVHLLAIKVAKGAIVQSLGNQ